VWAVCVVVVSPVGDKYLSFEEAVELFDREQFFAYSTAVGLDPGVLPGRSRVYVAGLRAGEPAPVAQSVSGEFGFVVAADELGAVAPSRGDVVQTGNGGVRVDVVIDEVGEGLAGELVEHMADLEPAARGGDIELEVQRPHMFRVLGFEQTRVSVGVARASAFAPLGRYPKALLAPQTLDFLAVHHPPPTQQHRMCPPIPPPGMLSGELAQLGAQVPVTGLSPSADNAA